ncbi:MAG TPA: hypothetical protein VMV47_14405 [Bacteroidales bacterium]|nr:hypothetical protein [Bacteroidales bacterium]
MIVYLKNNEIDRDLWDTCIMNSHELNPYGYSWFLDIMAPGWQALVDDDYDSVFPLPGFSRFGIRYLATPVFLQQLGAFSPDKPSPDMVNEFLEYLPSFYRLVDLCVGQKIEHEGFSITEKVNFEIDLSQTYENLREHFTTHCKRNIDSASRKKPHIVVDVTPDKLIDLFIRNKGKEVKGIKPRDYQRLNNLMKYCLENRKGRIIGVRSGRKELIFGTFIVETKGNKTMLLVVNTPQSRERRIGYFVVNEIIKESASTHTRLDFAGSSIPSIASYMESFGAVRVPFYRIYQNRLFWPVRMLK